MKHANLPRQLQAQVQSIPAYPDAPYEKAGSTINQEARDNGHAATHARAELMEVRRENDGSLEKAESEAIVGARAAPPAAAHPCLFSVPHSRCRPRPATQLRERERRPGRQHVLPSQATPKYIYQAALDYTSATTPIRFANEKQHIPPRPRLPRLGSSSTPSFPPSLSSLPCSPLLSPRPDTSFFYPSVSTRGASKRRTPQI